MPIELHPMLESDIPAHVNIMWLSFGPDLLSVFYPRGMSPNDLAQMRADTLKSMRKTDPTSQTLYIKAIDTSLPSESNIVSTAKWQIYPAHRSSADLDRADEEGSRETLFSEGADVEAMKVFFGELAERRREKFGGEPYVLLSILAVHPEHQRRGLGSMQLEYGLKKADEMGLRAYLESSPKGKGLYRKWGFEEEGTMRFDARDYGRGEDVVHTFMTRPARQVGGK
jgi:GNAT superfamily N-acetyltransferase